MNITELKQKYGLGDAVIAQARAELEREFQAHKQTAQQCIHNLLWQHGCVTKEALQELKQHYQFGDRVVNDLVNAETTQFQQAYAASHAALRAQLYQDGQLQPEISYQVQQKYGFGDPVSYKIDAELRGQFEQDFLALQTKVHAIAQDSGCLSSIELTSKVQPHNPFGISVTEKLIAEVIAARQQVGDRYRLAYAAALRSVYPEPLISADDEASLLAIRQQDEIQLGGLEVSEIRKAHRQCLNEYIEEFKAILYQYDWSDRDSETLPEHILPEFDDGDRAALENLRTTLRLESADTEQIERALVNTYIADLHGYVQRYQAVVDEHGAIPKAEQTALKDYSQSRSLQPRVTTSIATRFSESIAQFTEQITQLIRNEYPLDAATKAELPTDLQTAIETKRLAQPLVSEELGDRICHTVLTAYHEDLLKYKSESSIALATSYPLSSAARQTLREHQEQHQIPDPIAHQILTEAIAELDLGEVTGDVLLDPDPEEPTTNVPDEETLPPIVPLTAVVAVPKTPTPTPNPVVDFGTSLRRSLSSGVAQIRNWTTNQQEELSPKFQGLTQRKGVRVGAAIGAGSVALIILASTILSQQQQKQINISEREDSATTLLGSEFHIQTALLRLEYALLAEPEGELIRDQEKFMQLIQDLSAKLPDELTDEGIEGFKRTANLLMGKGHNQRAGHILRLIPGKQRDDNVLYTLHLIDKRTIKSATEEYKRGKLEETIKQLNSILDDSSLHLQVQALIAKMNQEWTQNKSWYDEIKTQFDAGKWQDVVNTVIAKDWSHPYFEAEAEKLQKEAQGKIDAERASEQPQPSVPRPGPGLSPFRGGGFAPPPNRSTPAPSAPTPAVEPMEPLPRRTRETPVIEPPPEPVQPSDNSGSRCERFPDSPSCR